jgi:hypothetical protein
MPLRGPCKSTAPAQVFSNARADYHITLFHFSHFQDTRPDPLVPTGGADLSVTAQRRPGPSQTQLQAEVEAARRVVGAAQSLQLQVWLFRRQGGSCAAGNVPSSV